MREFGYNSLWIIWILTTTCSAADFGKVTQSTVSDGVYLFTTAPYGVGLSGNAVAIVTDDGVLVFDSNGLPETARTVIARMRQVTDKPVRFLVNSHWHWDHWAGNEIYQIEYPGVRIVAHERTRELMQNVEPRWNEEGLKSGLPGYLARLEKQLAAARAGHRPATEIAQIEELLEAGRHFLKEKASLRKVLPDLTFSDALTIYLDDREVRIHHVRAITAGDAYVHLPGAGIVITGDILLSPYPFAIGGTYPSEWLAALKEIAVLEPTILIPGHGAPQSRAYLDRTISLYERLLEEVELLRGRGVSLEQCVESIGQEQERWAAILGITQREVVVEFRSNFLDTFVARAYREIEKPLDDFFDRPV